MLNKAVNFQEVINKNRNIVKKNGIIMQNKSNHVYFRIVLLLFYFNKKINMFMTTSKKLKKT